MAKRRSGLAAKGIMAFALVAAMLVTGMTAYAAPADTLAAASIDDGGYTVYFEVGPYDVGDMQEDDMGTYFVNTLTPDAVSKMGVAGGSMDPQTTGETLNPVGTNFWVVGYSFTEWALVLEDDEGNSIAMPANLPDGCDTSEFLDGYADELGGEVTLAGVWEPFEGYTVKFMSGDNGNGVLATRGSEEGGYLEWNSDVAAPTDAEMAQVVTLDENSPIAFMYKDDASAADIAERANIKWYTKPGGPDGGGLLWTPGGKFYTTVTSGSMTDDQAIAADQAVRANNNTVQLYPYYAANSVTVEYYGNGSDGDTGDALAQPSQSIAVGQKAYVLAPENLTKNNGKSTFVGWSYDKDIDPSDTDNILVPGVDEIEVTASTENPIKLYAVWSDSYILKYDPNGGTFTGSLADKDVNALTETNLLPTGSMSKVGYDASGTAGGVTAGWYVADASGNPTGNAVSTANSYGDLYDLYHDNDGAVTLTYVFLPKNYTVNYNWNGGYTAGTTNPASDYVKNDQLWDDAIAAPDATVLATVERPGYELDYWTLDDGTTQLSSSTYGDYSIAAGNTTGDTSTALTVKAHWRAKNAVVNYIPLLPDGASGSITGSISQATTDKNGDDLLAGGTVALPSSGYSLDGWTLTSWWTGSEDDEGNVTLIASVGNAGADWAVTSEINNLYTVWTANTYTVKVHGDTETTTPATYDETVITPAHPTTVPEGFTFGGWATKEGVTSTSDPDCVSPTSGTVASGDDVYTNLTTDAGATVELWPVWVPNDITVTLHVVDPATDAETTSSVTRPAASTDFALAAPTDVMGYIFAGWYTEEDGAGDFYGLRAGTSKTESSLVYNGTLDGTDSAVDGGKTSWPTANTDLYAYFTEMEGFAIVFVNTTAHKDSSGNPPLQTLRDSLKWTDTVTLPDGPAVDAKAADGYTFKGWYKQSDLTNGIPKAGAAPVITAGAKYSEIVTAMGLTDITATTPSSPVLYAGWVADPAEVELQNGAFTTAGGVNRVPAVSVATGGIPVGATEYTVDTTVGAEPALPNLFALEGYKFKYWKLGDGDGAKYYDVTGAELDSDGNATGGTYKANATGTDANALVAQWEPISYTVKFEDGAGVLSATTLTVYYDDYDSAMLPGDNLFTRAGYAFKSWKDTVSNDEFDAATALTKNLRSTEGEVVLQAQWTAEVTYTFTQGEGTLVMGTKLPNDQSVASGGTWAKSSVPDVPAGLVRAGYVADGWTDGTNDYKREVEGVYNVPTTAAPLTVTLYPKWVASPASVVLHYNDGATANLTVADDTAGNALVTGASIALPTAPTRPGYTFMGWSAMDDGAIDQIDGDVSATATTYKAPAGNPSNLYAVWQAGGVTISFNGNGATSGSMTDQIDLVVGAESGMLNANAFTRDGYSFVGWALSAGGPKAYVDKQQFDSTVKVPAPASGDTSIVMLYAVWEPQEYTITFKPNGADGNPADGTQVVTADESPVALAGPAYVRAGYTLEGWSTSSSRTAYVDGTDWRQGASYDVDFSGAASANTLYAIWKPRTDVTYTIERYREALDGSWEKVDESESTDVVPVGEQSGVTTGDTASIASEPANVYVGFTRDETVTDATLGDTKLSGVVTADGNLVLRVFYTRNVHSISYKLYPAGQATPSGWTLPAGATDVKFGAANQAVDATPVVVGWTFTGWDGSYTDADGNTQTLESGDTFTMPDQNVVLTGSWEQDKYTVTFDANGGAISGEPSPDIEVPSGQKMDATQKAAAQAVTFTLSGHYAASWQKSVDDGATWNDCNDPWDEAITADTVFRPVYAETFAVVYKPGIGGDFTDDTHDGLDPNESGKDMFPAFDTNKEQSGTPKAKAGYTFTGWLVVDADGDAAGEKGNTYTINDVTAKTSTAIDGNYTLEAQWSRVGYNLALDYDGGSVDVASTVVAKDADAPAYAVTVTKGDTAFAGATVGTGLNVTLPSVSKPGYTFGGWEVVQGTLTHPVGALGTFEMPAMDVELKAIWSGDSATITYRSSDSEKGSVTVTQQDVNPSTGDVQSATPAIATTLGSSAEPVWGYEVVGWKRVSDGEVVGADAAFVPQPSASGEYVDETYEALFGPAKVKIEFEKVAIGVNIGYGRSIDVSALTQEEQESNTYHGSLPTGKVIANTAADSGYKCVGWLYEMETESGTVANDYDSPLADVGELVLEGDVKFWPAWVPSKVDVVYNLNDPRVANVDDNSTFAEKAEVDAEYAVKNIDDVLTPLAGYDFLGWATSSDGGVVYTADDVAAGTAKIDAMPYNGVTFYAKWEAKKVEIVYEPGRRAAAEAVSFKDLTHSAGETDVAVLKLNETDIEAASGYTFAGWLGSDGVTYLDPDAAAPKATFDVIPGGGLTLTAQWRLADSKLVYIANGGYSPDGKGTEIKVDSAALLDVIAWSKNTVEHGNDGNAIFARDGYTFTGWNEKDDGTGTAHAPGSRFTMPADGGIELFAQWIGDYAEVVLNADGGTFAGDRDMVTYTGVTDQEITATDTPTRPGYVFRGWSTEAGSLVPDEGLADDGTGATLTLGRLDAQEDYADSTELHAVWVAEGAFVATVTDDGVEGGTVEGVGDYEVADGSGLPATVKAVPADGYELDGWEVNGTLVDETDATKLVITKDSTVKPHFSKKAQVDKAALVAAITAAKNAENGIATSTDGKDIDPSKKWTTAAEKKALDDAIAAAQAVVNNASATQAEVDAAVAKMNSATATYEGAKKNGSKTDPAPAEEARVMYRLYNPNSGEHFYTASVNERDGLVKVGWNYEGVGWVAPVTSNTPVYRLYSGTDHHYTTSKNERDGLIKVGWKDEGIGWYSDDQKRVPLFRQFNPNVNPKASRNNSGSHNYTVSKTENDFLVSVGWKAEGIGWYALSVNEASLPAGYVLI